MYDRASTQPVHTLFLDFIHSSKPLQIEAWSAVLPPQDVVLILVPVAVFVVYYGKRVGGVAVNTVRLAANEIDCIADPEVDQGLGEIVERLRRAAHCHKYFSSSVAQGLADVLSIVFVLNELAVVHERKLPEEIAPGLG